MHETSVQSHPNGGRNRQVYPHIDRVRSKSGMPGLQIIDITYDAVIYYPHEMHTSKGG